MNEALIDQVFAWPRIISILGDKQLEDVFFFHEGERPITCLEKSAQALLSCGDLSEEEVPHCSIQCFVDEEALDFSLRKRLQTRFLT